MMVILIRPNCICECVDGLQWHCWSNVGTRRVESPGQYFSFSSLKFSKSCLIRCQRGSLPQNSRTARMLSSLLIRCDAFACITNKKNWLMTTPICHFCMITKPSPGIDHRMWEMRLSALLTPWNLPRCSILKASLNLNVSCCWPGWTWKISFRLLDVHQHTHGQISLVWTSDQVKPTFHFCQPSTFMLHYIHVTSHSL